MRLRVNAKTPSRCLSCTGECPSGLDGLTPLALARQLGDHRIIKLVSAGSKRERKASVKERAEQIGVDLPPTPPEAREPHAGIAAPPESMPSEGGSGRDKTFA